MKFWQDKWLPSNPGGRLFSSPPDDHCNDRVKEWRNADGVGWRFEKLSRLVTIEEKQTISKVRCRDSGSPDFITWCHTKNGDFSVRSAYHLEVERRSCNLVGSYGDPLKKLWKQILVAKVLQKVKHLVWRAVTNSLPTRGKLVEGWLGVS